PKWHLRIAVVYGVALALTLDEFALWLRLADVYWGPEGVESLKAGGFGAAFLALYAFGQPAWHAVMRGLFRRPPARWGARARFSTGRRAARALLRGHRAFSSSNQLIISCSPVTWCARL